MNNLDYQADHLPNIRFKEDTQNKGLLENARSNFIRKVYATVGIQILITCAFVMLSTFNVNFQQFQYQNKIIFWIALITSILTLLVINFFPGTAVKSPFNIVLLSLFTLAESYIVSLICTHYTPESVLNVTVATLGAALSLTYFAIYTKSDFTQVQSNILAFLCSFVGNAISIVIFNIFIFRGSFLTILIAIIIGSIYSIFLIIDTQLIIGDKDRKITLDNYVLGAILLYTDLVRLFLKLLQILGKLKGK